MAEPSPDKIVIGAIGPLITSVIGAAIGWLPCGLTGAIGPPFTVLLDALGGISGLAFSLMYTRVYRVTCFGTPGASFLQCQANYDTVPFAKIYLS